MTMHCKPPAVRREAQFTLAALFEYVTLCAILAALSPLLGLAGSIFLMLMTLALSARQGLLALTMLIAASLAADWPYNPYAESPVQRQLLVLLAAGALCGWRHFRRSHPAARAIKPCPETAQRNACGEE